MNGEVLVWSITLTAFWPFDLDISLAEELLIIPESDIFLI